MVRWLLTMLVGLAGLGQAACSDTVDPVLDTGRAFTVYGLLDARADTQAVRVFAIEQVLDLVRPEPLNATVTSTEVNRSAVQTWQEEIVQFTNGRYGHVFWAPLRVDFNKTHRLELRRPDNVMTSVQVTMPPASGPERLNPILGTSYAVLPVLWRDAPRLHDIRVAYRTNFGIYRYEYPLDQETRPDGVVVDIQLSKDAREIFRALNRARIPVRDLRLREVILTVLVSSSEWVPPGGVYDPDVLIEPGVFSNVENGFGFVGAGYDTLLAFDPPDSIKVAAGIPTGNN